MWCNVHDDRWDLPGETTKSKRDDVVPMTKSLAVIFDHQRRVKDSKFVFPRGNDRDKPIAALQKRVLKYREDLGFD